MRWLSLPWRSQSDGSPAALSSRLVAAALTSLLLAAMLGGCSSGRSAESFCKELKQGTEKLRSNSRSANGNLTGQLGLIVQNLADYTRMIRRLDDVAPDEIKTDMHAAREAWDAQAEQMAEAAKNPFGAIIASLMTSIMSGASFEAVDTYALQSCGLKVFGATTPSGSAAAKSPGCPASTTGAGDISNWTFTQLTDVLGALSDSTDSQVTSSSEQVLQGVRALQPAPATATEALARAVFQSPTEFRSRLATLRTSVAAYCGGEPLGSAESTLPGPHRDATGSKSVSDVRDLFGICPFGGDLGLTPPMTLVAACEDGTVKNLDLTNGGITDGPHLPQLSDYTTCSSKAQEGAYLAWVRVQTTPADGLKQATHSVFLDIASVTSESAPTEVALVRDLESAQPPTACILASGAGNLLVSVDGYDSNTSLVQLRSHDTGNLVAELDAEQLGDRSVGWESVTSSSVAFTRSLVDLKTGRQIIADHASIGIDSGCEDSGAVLYDDAQGNPAGVLLTSVRGITSTRNLSARALDYLRRIDAKLRGATGEGLVVESGTDQSLQLIGPDGPKWKIRADVVKDAHVSLGWLLVTNSSDEVVVVDPATGQEVSGLDETTKKSIIDFPYWGNSLAIGPPDLLLNSPETDTLLFADDGVVTRLVRSQVCASARAP